METTLIFKNGRCCSPASGCVSVTSSERVSVRTPAASHHLHSATDQIKKFSEVQKMTFDPGTSVGPINWNHVTLGHVMLV